MSSIRILKSGGAPLGKQVEESVRTKFPKAILAKEALNVKSGACGTVVRNAEMKIVDPETNISLPPNKSGEGKERKNAWYLVEHFEIF